MTNSATSSDSRYDVSICYSRKDVEFARQLEKALRTHRPRIDEARSRRRLRVFRETTDFQSIEYATDLDHRLRNTATLVVICTPNSAASGYVADEIRRFAAFHGADRIVPILLAGNPSSGAHDEQIDLAAFSQELLRVHPQPLAIDYRGFDFASDKVERGRASSPLGLLSLVI